MIKIPEKRQDSSMGRRLFAMAAPIAGMALGGPAGAAAGSFLANKVSGQTTKDAALGAAGGAAQGAFGRRAELKSGDPQVKVQEGLGVLSTLPQDDPLRQSLTAPLVKSQMLGASSKYGMYGQRSGNMR